MKIPINKIRINIGVIIFVFIMTLIVPDQIYSQEIIVEFEVENNSPCEKLVKFINNSDNATNYLWEISRQGYETIVTPTHDPVIAFENIVNATDFIVKLTAYNITTGLSDYVSKTITIYPTPEIKFKDNWQTMVCSNSDAVEYCVEINEGDNYAWSASGNDVFYELESSSINTACLLVNWKENTEPQPVEITLICKITSPNGCINTISNKVLLLPTALPESALIRRKDDTNILLCVFDSPIVGGEQISDDYSYQWGFYPRNDSSNQTYLNVTENAYQQFEDFNIDNVYFVDIFRKEYNYCKSRIEGITGNEVVFKAEENIQLFDVVNVFPNPVNGTSFLNLNLHRYDSNLRQVRISILNFLGVTFKSELFEISQEFSHLVISLDNLQNGTYFIEAISDGKQKVVKKFIVLNN